MVPLWYSCTVALAPQSKMLAASTCAGTEHSVDTRVKQPSLQQGLAAAATKLLDARAVQ